MDISPDDPAATPAETSWHFDKRVPLAMLGALVLQTVSIAWWASGVTFRLEDHERRVTALARRSFTACATNRPSPEMNSGGRSPRRTCKSS